MSNGPTPNLPPLESHQLLPAFADGELDTEQNLRALESMASDPENTKRVLHQQQLKQACARVMDTPEMRCPDELRGKITAMMATEAEPTVAETASEHAQGSPVIARIGQWVAPLAVAATLFIGAVVALNVINDNRKYTSDGILTASLAQTFGDRHVKCALGQQAPYATDLFPASVSELDEAIAQQVGQAIEGAALDLSVLGYDYQLAGLCPIPGGDAVHVIYENAEGQALSLWIKAYDGKPVLDPGRAYIPPQDHTSQPMMVWRDGDMVFYLVGNTMDEVEKVQPAIQLAVAL
ncbi:MAG: hypothetical protein AAGH99_16185 [Planctomycetota bacterium]